MFEEADLSAYRKELDNFVELAEFLRSVVTLVQIQDDFDLKEKMINFLNKKNVKFILQ